mmetsp:Transcript_87998/g.249303  ORF Transcript_87998/g.249303 Transcript_87998/m.249303 type:complete len:315 (+) Transcript_87998:927-1871(+)
MHRSRAASRLASSASCLACRACCLASSACSLASSPWCVAFCALRSASRCSAFTRSTSFAHQSRSSPRRSSTSLARCSSSLALCASWAGCCSTRCGCRSPAAPAPAAPVVDPVAVATGADLRKVRTTRNGATGAAATATASASPPDPVAAGPGKGSATAMARTGCWAAGTLRGSSSADAAFTSSLCLAWLFSPTTCTVTSSCMEPSLPAGFTKQSASLTVFAVRVQASPSLSKYFSRGSPAPGASSRARPRQSRTSSAGAALASFRSTRVVGPSSPSSDGSRRRKIRIAMAWKKGRRCRQSAKIPEVGRRGRVST